ncbi:helix-turn-helix domain-containing protein [Sulfitobacter sp. JB4-11]|uniref:helix-turn-helix domain-containing protein n=1 Tax=Sulfitobacter rhodophyticola TaxID=3238304 RepID=UPI0035133693
MSHAATNWAIKQKGLKPATKIVLWHLCDRHNPDYGCFPMQETLAKDCEMSRSTLNVHLKKLEKANLIKRHKSRDEGNNRQRPTRYELAFEKCFKAVSENRTDTPKAVSGSEQKPCPENEQSRVLKSDSNSVREPVKEPVRAEPDQVGYLSQVLSTETAEAFVVSRKAMKKPMTVFAAKLMRDRLAEIPNAEDEAKRAIRNGWQDVYPEKKRDHLPDSESAMDRWKKISENYK